MKTFVGPRLRQLRREHGHTQAEMANRLGVSPAYINLMEHNQRSLSVRVLVGLLESYGVDWQDLVSDNDDKIFDDLRRGVADPIFSDKSPDARELRSAIENPPVFTSQFMKLYGEYRMLVENMMRLGHERMPQELLTTSAETVIHDFFRSNSNFFPELEREAAKLNADLGESVDDIYSALKGRLKDRHGILVKLCRVEELGDALRIYTAEDNEVLLSEGLDHINRVFQLAHLLCFLECDDALEKVISRLTDDRESVINRCKVEVANYFAAALLMPYDVFLTFATESDYDIDRMAARFGVSFEQVCHRLTTLQREGNKGIPFFFLRVDKAGNVTKRFNSTAFQIAEYGGS